MATPPNRDLPEVVSELIIEMHEMHSELKGLRADIQAMPERISAAMFKSREPFLVKMLDNNDQLKNHEQRLNRLDNPQA